MNHPIVSADEVRPELKRIGRRGLLRRGLSLGALTLLTGCDLSTHSGVDAALWSMLRFNDRVQAALFSRTRLAETYPASAITRPFRFNAYYPEWQVRTIDASQWQLEVAGLVTDRAALDRATAGSAAAENRRSRGISASRAGARSANGAGVPLHVFLRRVGADLRARYVAFTCFDGYSTSIDMPSALHPQTILALDFEQAAAAAAMGRAAAAADPDEARVQECQEPAIDQRDEQISRRLLGEPGLRLVRGSVVATPAFLPIRYLFASTSANTSVAILNASKLAGIPQYTPVWSRISLISSRVTPLVRAARRCSLSLRAAVQRH